MNPWSGFGYAVCAERLNNEFESIFYKNNFGFGVAYINLYIVGCIVPYIRIVKAKIFIDI